MPYLSHVFVKSSHPLFYVVVIDSFVAGNRGAVKVRRGSGARTAAAAIIIVLSHALPSRKLMQTSEAGPSTIHQRDAEYIRIDIRIRAADDKPTHATPSRSHSL